MKGLGVLDSSISTFKRTRVFAIGTPEECRALSWGFRHLDSSSSSPEITESSLDQINEARQEADFLVVFVDLGQPVPITAIGDVAQDIPGVVVFTQPTPTQLMSVFRLHSWTAQLWDGSNAEQLAKEIYQHLKSSDKLLRQKIFFRDAVKILGDAKRLPEFIEWVNPPKNWNGNTRFTLDSIKGYFSIGSESSKCDLELPLKQKGLVMEFRWIDEQWIVKLISNEAPVSGLDPKMNLKIGDSFKIGEHLLTAKAHQALSQLTTLAAQESELLSSTRASANNNSAAGETSLASYLQELLLKNFTGEVQINSGLRRGTISFHTGSIDQVFAGPVEGEKALERILTWPSPSWRAKEGPYTRPNSASLLLLPTEFSIFTSRVQRDWDRIAALAPPINLHLDIDAKKFGLLNNFSARQTKVLAAISEFRLVRDILNYCPLFDIQIYENLVDFRKTGLIRIHK